MRRDNLLSGYSAFFLARETYTEEEALNRLRAEFRSYKGIRPGFLKHLEEDSAFSATKEYIPVYRLSAKAEYIWESASKTSAASDGKKKSRAETYMEHREERKVECTRFRAPDELQAREGKGETTPVQQTRAEELVPSLYDDSWIPFKENEKELKRTAADYSPASSARILLSDMCFEVIFLPVLKAVCTYEDGQYVCYVNLHCGACTVEYPVSEAVEAAVEKTLRKVKTAKLCVGFAGLFILAFGVLALIKFFRAEGSVAPMTLAGLFALAFVPLAAFLRTLSYKRGEMARKAGGSGRVSGGLAAGILIVAAWAAAGAALFIFALYVL